MAQNDKPLSLSAKVNLRSGSALGDSSVRISSEVGTQIGFDTDDDKRCCVLVGQSARFPSWNPVCLPLKVEVAGATKGPWIDLPTKLPGLELINLDQPWDLLVVDVHPATSIVATLDSGWVSQTRSRAQNASTEDLIGSRFVAYPGNEVRIGDTEQGRRTQTDSTGTWPWRISLNGPSARQLHVLEITEETDIERREGTTAVDRKLSLVVLVDCSGSMDDGAQNDKSRLKVARDLAYDLFESSCSAESGPIERCAIVAYGANVVRLFPETRDSLGTIHPEDADRLLNAVRHIHSGLLDDLKLERYLSDMPLGLLYAGYLLEQADDLGHERVVLLISDGESEDAYEKPDDVGSGQQDLSSKIAGDLANNFDITVSTVFVDDQAGPSDRSGSGRYLPQSGQKAESNSPEALAKDRDSRRKHLERVAKDGSGKAFLHHDQKEIRQALFGY